MSGPHLIPLGRGRQKSRCGHPPSLFARCQNAGPAFRVMFKIKVAVIATFLVPKKTVNFTNCKKHCILIGIVEMLCHFNYNREVQQIYVVFYIYKGETLYEIRTSQNSARRNGAR